MARGVLGEMMFIQNSIDIKANKRLVKAFADNVDLKFYFQPGKKLGKATKTVQQKLADNKLFILFDLLPIIDPLNRFKIELENQGFKTFAISKHPKNNDFLLVQLQLKHGVLNFSILEKRINNSAKYVFTLWMVLTSVLTSIISILFLKNQIKSIKGLSLAAEKLGRGGDAPDFRPSGAKEIRLVGISFIKMKARITRQILQRTQMLSAVSHDLRTPLTRMKLQLEMMPKSQEVADLGTDIVDMQKMINEYLDFAKSGDIQREKSKDVLIKAFLEKIVIYYQKMHHKISCKLSIDKGLQISIKQNSLRRAIRNLIDNSLHYGSEVQLSATMHKNILKIIVDDNGCGVLEQERSEIFKPFYRIDNARNLDKANKKGGAGLGLAIVFDVISSHGGKIKAEQSPQGGLRMVIELPV